MYENINGAEYIGNIDIKDGLEFHIYDKDGKVIVIAWSDNSQNNITIDYVYFIAYDMYGKEIENTDGNLIITSSPIYRENLNKEYFYLAIANVAKNNIQEILTKYDSELANQEQIKQLLNNQITYLKKIEERADTTKTQDLAEENMKVIYEIGNQLIKAQVENQLLVEDIKLSSMLDSYK